MSEFLLSYDRLNGQCLELLDMQARDPATNQKTPLGAGANVRATVYTKRDGLPIAGLTALQFTYRSPGEFYRVLTGAELSDEADRYEVEAHGDDGQGSPFAWRRPLRVKTRRNGQPLPTGAIGAAMTWDEHPDIALLVFAEDQTAGSQTVVARVGPNGWLGDSAGDAVNDPTLNLTAPARWVFGEVAGVGLTWGDVLADVLDDPAGFTIALPIEMATIDSLRVLWQKALPSPENGPIFYMGSGGYFEWTVYYAEGGADIDLAHSFGDARRVPVGRSVAAVHLDRTLPRATRHQLWLNGAALTTSYISLANASGDGVALNSTGSIMRVGGPLLTRMPPQAVPALVIARGVMTPAWHAAMHADMVARGWT